MHSFTFSYMVALVFFLGVASAWRTATLSRRQSPNSFNFDFEHPETGDVGTIVWDLSTIPVRHPLVGDALADVKIDREITDFARSAFAASVTGEDIYCEMFQTEDCTRSRDQPSFCVVGEKFQATNLELAPFREIWPLELHGKMKCLLCDKKTAEDACSVTGERI
ncbi:hypothetical protein BDZ91DRAFT_719043 [Kalaharituber pfeilii]|nr:hypothetical protein BDZ91DRAFT_719043 [Kalaharituber pfeilii]